MIYSARIQADAQVQSLVDRVMSLRFPTAGHSADAASGAPTLRAKSASDITASDIAASDITAREIAAAESLTDQYDHELATQIMSRIQVRLPGRIRYLTVFTTENAVILTGECATFYTKQLAQHAAMGVLEYEQLINNIEVRTA